ncbi:MAG TPA: hypothetical protein VFL70_06470 [Bacteroidia bacterium]|nr:hypothetical protein [Bacteroidia bacterium]
MATSNKSLLFFLGLVSGTVVGAGFFLLDLNEFFKKSKWLQTSADTETSQIVTNDNLSLTKAKNKKTDTTRKRMNSSDLLSSKYSLDTPLVTVLQESDSLLKHSPSFSIPPTGNENITVRKDKLLSTKVLQIESTEKPNEVTQSDSILEKISGIKNTAPSSSFRRLEFWLSPINYKGYKLTQNKLVLFGINPDLEIKLYNHNGKIFMKYDVSVYELNYADDFKQFEKATNSSLLESIK